MTEDQAYQKALEYCARRMLYTWDAINKHDTIPKALEYSFHIWGGFTLPDEYRPYWMFEQGTWKSGKMVLVKERPHSNADYPEVKISRKEFVRACERVLSPQMHIF